MIDVAKLLEPVSDESPCGEDLEYDEAFTELQLISQYKPEQQMGDAIIPAEEPVWRDVETKAASLFKRTKDLRVAAQLTKALMHTGGFVGASQGFEVLRSLIEDRWAGLHPALDPDDDDDPTMRFNILADLADASTVIRWVKAIPMVSVRGLGSFGLRSYELASGESVPVAGESAPDMTLIDGAFSKASLEELRPTAAAVRACANDIARIENLLMGYAQGAMPPNLTPLRKTFEQAAKVMDGRIADRVGEAGETQEELVVEASGAEAGTPAARAPAKGFSGEITSRKDVLTALEKMIEYYERFEPSSPLPMLLARCKRLVNKSFMEIIRDMAPDGISQVEKLRGPEQEG